MNIVYFITFLIIILINIKSSISNDPGNLACQFTDGFCRWTNDENTWKLGDFDNVTFGRPIHPVSNGGYIYVEDGPNHSNQILSPTVDVTSFCLSFHYYMFGPDVGQLTLRLIDDNDSGNSWIEIDDDVWIRKGSQSDDWLLGRYHFTSDTKKSVRIAFVATSNNIALGPFKVNQGSCDYSDTCNFEDMSVCFWQIEPDYSSNFAWYLSDGRTSSGQFIIQDTTTRSESGKFLRTPDEGSIDSKSHLSTVVTLNSDEARCLSFNLYKPNANSDLVEVNWINNQSESQYIWTSASIKPNLNWQPVKISLTEPGDFGLLITAHKYSDEASTSVAIDDLQVSPQPCTNLIDCSFDDTNCILSITSGPLLIGFGRLTNAESLGYSFDSYRNNDPDNFFLYTDTPDSNDSTTYVFSTVGVPSTDLACLSFSYFIQSLDSFANYLFQINVQSSSGYKLFRYEPPIIFEKWGSIELIVSTIELSQIQFILTTESRLFAAFDDIKLVEGQCGEKNEDSSDEAVIYKKDSLIDPSQWSNWYQWSIQDYNVDSPKVGFPSSDPFGDISGKYIALFGNYDNAILQTPVEDGFYCLSLWFWCSGGNSANLVALALSQGHRTSLFDETCENPNHWKLLEATFNSDQNFTLEIIASIEEDIIGLAEMTIFSGPCYHDQVIGETCTFDDGTDCGIEVVASPYYNWRIESGSQLSTPMVDKSTNTLNGKSIALDLSPAPKIDSTSYFYLANLRKEDSYCISFAYYIKGYFTLGIWKTEKNNIEDLPDPLVTYDHTFGSSWIKVSFQIDSITAESDIVFGGSYTGGITSGLIAVDDLTVSLGECIDSAFCDFDSVCAWTILPIGTSFHVESLQMYYDVTTQWQVGLSSDAKSLGYPRKDHTYPDLVGSYGYTANTPDELAILASPIVYLGESTSICLKFAYVVDSTGNLELLIEQQENKAYVYKNFHADGLRNWNEVQQSISLRPSPTKMVRVYLVSSLGGQSAVDDLEISPGTCPKTEYYVCSNGHYIAKANQCNFIKDCPDGDDEENCGSCQFSSNACGFTASGQAVWSVKDSYIALDKSRIGVEITGALASPMIQETSASCKLTFSYAKHQSDYLIVYLFMGANKIQIWESGMINENSDWNDVSIELGRMQTPFQVVFSGTTTFRVFEYEQLSIDYVEFVDCGFDSTETNGDQELFTCSNGQQIGSSRICDTTLDCVGGEDEANCDNTIFTFEHGQLNPWFNSDENSKYKWVVTSGVSEISLKPTLDHTRRLPSGSYAFLSTTDGQSKTNFLTGPELNTTENCEIVLYYYLSSKPSKINVYATNSDKVILETIDEPSDFGFKRLIINLDSNLVQAPFRVAFEGVIDTNSESSLIALDDISFSPACYGKSTVQPTPDDPVIEPEPEPQNCNGKEFYCSSDEKCIYIEKTCDYVNDCSDGADEQYCGSCDFSRNLCGWLNEGLNLWIAMDNTELEELSSTGELEGFPDNTSNPENFLIATNSPTGGSAAIRSPLLGKTSSICVFKFKYLVSPDTKLSVRIRQEYSVVSKTVQELKQDSADSLEWSECQIDLTSLEYNHYIQFVLDSQPSDEYFLSTALGDFKFLYCDPSKVNFDAFNCNFEKDFCNWIEAGSKSLSWKLLTASSYPDDDTKFGFGKYSNQDHPSFINLDISSDSNKRSIRTLTSPWNYATDDFCFSFDYRLLAFDATSFSLVIETPGSIMKTLFTKNGEPNYGWNQAKVMIKNVDEFRLTFKVEMNSNANQTVISLDNLALSSESCAFHQASCDFTLGTCDWVNQGWTIVQNQLIESDDGLSRNYFLRSVGSNQAKLILNGFDVEESPKCLSFWYSHTFNVSSNIKINSIKNGIIISTEVVDPHEIPNIWSYYRSPFLISTDYQISIETGPLSNYDTIGLDDITLYDGPCGSPGDCDFTFDSCGWKNTDLSQWKRNLGVTPSTDNSLADNLHFEDRSWFLYIRMNDLVEGNLATIESGMFTRTSPVCLTFKYLFTSGQFKENKLKIKFVDIQQDLTQILDEVVDDGTIEWLEYENTIISGYKFKVLLSASASSDGSGDLAIDDIKFTDGKCSNYIEPTTIPIPTEPPTTQAIPITEETESSIDTTTTIPETTTSKNENNSVIDKATSFLTANTIFFLMKENAYLIVAVIAVICMLLFPMAFVVHHLIKPTKSYQPNENSVAMDNKIYDIYLETAQNVTTNEIYENVDTLSSSLKFEMKRIAESEGL